MRFFVFTILFVSAFTANTQYQCLRDILSLGKVSEARSIAVRGSYEIKTMLTLYDNMPSSIKGKIKKCKLNLNPAKQRCEKSYGEGNCEQLSPAAYQTKCDKYFIRVGCCHCAMRCPKGWKEDDYHCIKPQQKNTKVFKSLGECTKLNKNGCEQSGLVWTAKCGIHFRRIGSNSCIPVCPLGWHDEGKRCRKPADYRMAQPFLWQKGDK